MIGHDLYVRTEGKGNREHPTLEVTWWRPTWSRWAFTPLPSIRYEGEAYEAQINIGWLCWAVSVWWAR